MMPKHRKTNSMDECRYEIKIIEMAEDIAETKESVKSLDRRINGSMDKIADHIAQGFYWRLAIGGVIGSFVIQVIIVASIWGSISKTVEINERMLSKITEDIDEIEKELHG